MDLAASFHALHYVLEKKLRIVVCKNHTVVKYILVVDLFRVFKQVGSQSELLDDS